MQGVFNLFQKSYIQNLAVHEGMCLFICICNFLATSTSARAAVDNMAGHALATLELNHRGFVALEVN